MMGLVITDNKLHKKLHLHTVATHLRILHLLCNLPPQMLSLHNILPMKMIIMKTRMIILNILLIHLLGNISQYHSLPPPARGITLALYILQSFQITKVHAVEAMLTRCGPRVSLRLNHVSKLQFAVWIHWAHIPIKTVD